MADVNNNRPQIKNGERWTQKEFDQYLATLPDRRRPSGLNPKELYAGEDWYESLSKSDKAALNIQETSEKNYVENGRTKYDGAVYDNINNQRLVDNVNHYSMDQVLSANEQINSGFGVKMENDPYQILDKVDLGLTRAQIEELQKNSPGTEKVLSARSLMFGTALKQWIDQKGWNIKDVHLKGEHNDTLRYTVQAGDTQVDIVGLTPQERHLGNFYANGRSIFRARHGLANVNTTAAFKQKITPQIEYMMTGLQNGTYTDFDVSTPNDAPNLQKVSFSKTQRGDRDPINYSFTISSNRSDLDNEHSLERQRERELLTEPRNLNELVMSAYEKARQSSDEKEVASLVDLDSIRLENGDIDLDKVDMNVISRHESLALTMRLVQEDMLERASRGEDIYAIRQKWIAGEHDESNDFEESLENEYEGSADGLMSLDEDAFEADGDESFAGQQGARERIVNLTAGMTDKQGKPLVGWMDLDSNPNKEQYLEALDQAREASLEAGVIDFDGRFDNDGVLHWNGNRVLSRDENGEPTNTKPIKRQLGQFYFPAVDDEYDENGALVRKKGVVDLKRANGKEDLRVDSFTMTFNPATDNKKHILERMRIKGFNITMQNAIHASVKEQILLSDNDDNSLDKDTMRDSTRLNRAYGEMTRIQRPAMERERVVEHLRNSFAIDKKYSSKDLDLSEGYVGDIEDADSSALENQDVRTPLRGLEGVYDPQMSSDGQMLGLRGYFTEEFVSFIEEERALAKAEGRKFSFDSPDGNLGMFYVDNGSETVIERWITSDKSMEAIKDVEQEVSHLKVNPEIFDKKAQLDALAIPQNASKDEKAKVIEQRRDLVMDIYEDGRSAREMFASPMVRGLRQNHAGHDSTDRVLMTGKMLETAHDVIGGPMDNKGRDKVRVALMSAGGQTFEDSIIISNEFAEQYNLRIGDKLADNHSNKGVIGYISGLDENHRAYNKDIEDAFKDAKALGYPLDMIQSPYGMASRANMGLGKELVNSSEETKGVIRYQEGKHQGEIRGYAGEISVIVTDKDAEHKTNLYELVDSGRKRTFSYQQQFALQSHGGEKTLNHILGRSEKKHMELMSYLNVVGYNVTEDNEIVRGRFGMKDEHKVVNVNGVDKSFEQFEDNKAILAVTSNDIEKYGFPKKAAYFELPIATDAYLHEDTENKVQTTHLPVLPERLRRETDTYTGEYMEHDYTQKLGRIANFSSQLESMQMDYLLTYQDGLEDFKEMLDRPDLTTNDLKQLHEEADPDFLFKKANYPFEEKMAEKIKFKNENDLSSKDLSRDLETYGRVTNLLKGEITKYQSSVEKDKIGNSSKTFKRSFVRRKILSNTLDNSATAILTNDSSLGIDEVGISPALGINEGVLEPVDKEKWEKALETADPHTIQEAARGNWKYKEGAKDHKLMVWRDPVLHDGSVSAYNYVVDERLTGVSVNPMITSGMSADFDGDTLGVAYISDEKVQKEWDEKLNIRYNLMDARNTLGVVNVGMDNVDYMKEWIADDTNKGFKQSNAWGRYKAQEDPKYFEENKPKDVLNDYVQYVEQKTIDETAKRFDTLSERYGFDRERYDELTGQGALQKDKLDMIDREIVDTGENIYHEAYREVVDKFTYEKLSELTEVVGRNGHNYKARNVNNENEHTVLDSLKEMAKDGAKGKEKDIANRHTSYLLDGVKMVDFRSVRTAQAAKVNEIGRSGSQTLKVTPVMANTTFYNQGRPINGATVAMDVTETSSQAILQLKHSPEDVPKVLRFLNESPKFFQGEGNFKQTVKERDDTREVWVQVSQDMLGLDSSERLENAEKILSGEEKGLFSKVAKEEEKEVATALDRMLAENVVITADNKYEKGDIFVDINHGQAWNKNPKKTFTSDKQRQKYFATSKIYTGNENKTFDEIDAARNEEKFYNLGFKAIFEDGGLSITDKEVDYYQKTFREVDKTQDNEGLMVNYEANILQNGDSLDIMAQMGAKGLDNIVYWNERNPEQKSKITDKEYTKPFKVNYKNVHTLMTSEYENSIQSYREQAIEYEKRLEELPETHILKTELVNGMVPKDVENTLDPEAKEIHNLIQSGEVTINFNNEDLKVWLDAEELNLKEAQGVGARNASPTANQTKNDAPWLK